MLRKTLEKTQLEFSGQQAFQHVASICQHHRIQASPGYRDAALYCLHALQEADLDAEIITFPADGETTYWTQQMFEEWNCQRARLDLLSSEGRCLADFAAEPMSLIQRSISTPAGGVIADVVWLKDGDDPTPYVDWDLTGCLVFTNGDINKVRQWAIEERGAIGIISDRLAEFPPVRHRFDIPDALQYTSFWWTGHEQRCFGFVLSPKAGDGLRRLCSQTWQEHLANPERPARPQVRADVVASCYSGSLEDVSALIPGETDEEIIVAAHLCHPKTSANDNASGVGTALEVARSLQAMIADGRLPKPKRGIRILLIPEMTGTYAYLATHEQQIPKIMAAINLDMVGERQELCQGPLVTEYPPDAASSFVGDVLAAIMDAVSQETKNLAGTSAYALFKHVITPFSGGSDHYIFSDPTVGVPCPMLIQWPDKYYHTSADTLDKVDPQMLYRVGCMTATYAYFLANLSFSDVPWLFSECRSRYLQQLSSLLHPQEMPTEGRAALAETRRKLDYRLERRVAELTDIGRFVQGAEQPAFARELKQEVVLLTDLTEKLWARFLGQSTGYETTPSTNQNSEARYRLVPRRLFRGPLSFRGKLEQLSLEERLDYQEFVKHHPAAERTPTYLTYWADGKRSLQEIDHLVQMEIGVSDVAFALRYFQLLESLGLVAWV